MASLYYTMKSGKKFEDRVFNLISQYTNTIWRNVRIETLLTKQGTTELDILFTYKDCAYIVECKNISSVYGNYWDPTWSFVGASHPGKAEVEYRSMSVLVQNNIHMRSFKDLFYSYFREWPLAASFIVVPNDCEICGSIREAISTLSEFDSYLASVQEGPIPTSINRRVASLFSGDSITAERPDFSFSEKYNKRVKVV